MDNTQKRESGFCLENATMIQIQDMFENGKPGIVLKTVKRLNIKRTPIVILIKKKGLKSEIIVLVMFKKMLVKVCIIDFYSGYGSGSQKPSLSICAISWAKC